MAKTVIVKLTNDMDGGDADETIEFALDGQSYEIDLSTANTSKLRQAFKPYIEKGRSSRGRGVRARSPRPSGPPAKESLYSKLSGEEKARFRAWANMPTARRISDARVKSWSASGQALTNWRRVLRPIRPALRPGLGARCASCKGIRPR